MSLKVYRQKRNFKKTAEPNSGRPSKKAPIFVVQEHWASHHHFDFRLESGGTLKSWAVPKGPSTKVGDKRLAVEVEDHPIDYAGFSGQIPEGEYGAGHVKIWDKGYWVPPKNVRAQLAKGHLEFELKGKKLIGKWLLQRTRVSPSKKNQWLLIKRHDDKIAAKLAPKKLRKSPWPKTVAPQLATLSQSVPQGREWLHEIKLDGYRTVTLVQKKSIKFLTRSGLDWTEKYSPLDVSVRELNLQSAILDGEIVVLDPRGHSSFKDLQAALKDGDGDQLRYVIFDLLYLNGQDLRELSLEERKMMLKKLLPKSQKSSLTFSEHFQGQGEDLFKMACKTGLEGIVSKRKDSPYVSSRTSDWLKTKCSSRQEFVIGGYSQPQGSRQKFGALLLGAYDKGKFRYVGRVGTGFDRESLDLVLGKLEKLTSEKNPFNLNRPSESSDVTWVKPKLVAEIEFRTWTGDQVLRHASFQGLREDKVAGDVKIESAKLGAAKAASGKQKKSKSAKEASSFRISHPDRVIYPGDDLTKLDVANYYRSVAPWMLQHLKDRPLSLVRCPDTVGGTCFFQKHVDTSKMHDIKGTEVRDQKINYIYSASGLLELIQWGVLEIHSWQSHIQKPENPDQIVFDLDPDPSVPWKTVVQTAVKLRALLAEIKLKSFVKTTGGKGLHVHVPIQPLYGWEEIKAFSKTICTQLQSEEPLLYTVNMSKKLRHKRIFLDYLRNGFGATSIAPYSLRNKDRATASVPITWAELAHLKRPDAFDSQAVLKRLAHLKKDPWPNYSSLKQKIGILKRKRSSL